MNPFTKFNNDWALVTSGNINNYNSMLISWGSMGTLWHKKIITIYIRPDRYTFNYLKENDYFTVSFYDEKYKDKLKIYGTKSGRDTNKAKLTNFHPKEINDTVTYQEAKETYVCKKIYFEQLNKDKFPEEAKKLYPKDKEAHYMIIGEVEKIETH